MRYRAIVKWATAAAVIVAALVLVRGEDRAHGSFHLLLANSAELRAPAAGFVRECFHDEGDRVSSGEVICSMEIPELAGQLAQTRAEAQSLRAMLQNLKGQGEGSRPADWARLAGLEEQTRYLEGIQVGLVLASPVDGIVTTPKLKHKVGRYFREGELVAQVQDPSLLDAEIALPERRIAQVRPGQRIELKALALPYRTLEATVTRVAPAVVEGEGENTVTAYCRLDAAASVLRPGMTGHARIAVGRRSLGGLLGDRIARFVRTEFWW